MSHPGHTSVSLLQNTADDYYRSPQSKLRIEAQLGAGLGDRYRAIIIRDVVNAGLAAREREQGRMGRSIDVQRRRASRRVGPGAWPVKQAVAQHDGLDAGAAKDLLLHIGGAFYRHGAGRV